MAAMTHHSDNRKTFISTLLVSGEGFKAIHEYRDKVTARLPACYRLVNFSPGQNFVGPLAISDDDTGSGSLAGVNGELTPP
jgi:hypothetical protein